MPVIEPSRFVRPVGSMRRAQAAIVCAALSVALLVRADPSRCTDNACSSPLGAGEAEWEDASLLSHRLRVEQRDTIEASPPNATKKHRHVVPRNAAEATGVKKNGDADLPAFLAGLGTNCIMVCLFMGVFMLLRLQYPAIFSNNVLKGVSPQAPPDSLFGWAIASWNLPAQHLEDYIGLDHAMLLEFTNLGMRIMFRIGVPLLLVLGPLNLFCGGKAAGEDHLSYLSIGNVEPNSWLMWLYPGVVWGIVVIVQVSVYQAQAAFLPRRFRWLRTMPEPRSTTVLVECVPPDHQSDEELRKFFVEMFSQEKVKSAYMVKHTEQLQATLGRKQTASQALQVAAAAWDTAGKDPAKRPSHLTLMGHFVDSIEYYTKEIGEAEAEAKEERERIQKASSSTGGVNTSAGFVTFHDRSDAEVALHLEFSADSEEWIVSKPPGPESIRWEDLKVDPQAASAETLLGYGFVVGLYLAYLPIVIGIAKVATMIDMGPMLNPFWLSFAPTIGLTLMVDFLPTFLILIFRKCFSLKDDAWAQQQLHVYYFWFNMVFVVLVTAVGSSVVGFTRALIEQPLSIFTLLGDKMPQATHFYMNYVVLHWVSHSMNMMRYINLVKFLALRKLYDEETARAMSEPEDQDFYGIASRSTRWTTQLVIGIVFSTISPMIAVLVFLNFAICRVWYGYLIPYAETRKPDLGGVFWVQKLQHIFIALGIYCVMMVGVLYGRASSPVPAFVTAASLIYLVWSYKRFKTEFSWEKLPFAELRRAPSAETTTASAAAAVAAAAREVPKQYVQPELLDS